MRGNVRKSVRSPTPADPSRRNAVKTEARSYSNARPVALSFSQRRRTHEGATLQRAPRGDSSSVTKQGRNGRSLKLRAYGDPRAQPSTRTHA